jgi:PII-like signaling protein
MLMWKELSGVEQASSQVQPCGTVLADQGTSVSGDGLKLTSYFGERHRTGREPTGNALLDLYASQEIAASLLLRGTQGFGLRQHLRHDRSLTLSDDLPVLTVAVDTRPRIEAVLEQTLAMAPGLVTLEHACLLDEDSPLVHRPTDSREGEAKLTVYLSRHDQAYQIPAYEAVCDLLYRRCVTGATTLLGVDGTARGHRQRAGFLSRRDKAPMMVIAVDSWDQIMSVLPGVSGLLRHPLMTLEPVRVCKQDGLAVPDRSPGIEEHGMSLWQKLAVYTSEAALHEGQAVHRILARRLLSAGISGVTTLCGVWGFRGEQAPHGDSALRFGRHVPALTTVIDAPDRIAAAFAIIDELTAERGLVTSETIPAIRATAGGGQKGQQ